MIFGITLKHFEKLLDKGEQVKNNFWINKLLQKKSNFKFKTKTIENLKFSDFVELEMYLEENNYTKFCTIFVKKYFWQIIYVHNLPLIMANYGEQKELLKEKYYYIFNPPQYGEPAKESVGSELRKEFVEEFGSYVVLMDMVCKDKSNYKQVENWKVSEFLFWANYLSGQRIIENVK